MRLVEKAHEKDEDADILDILRVIQHTDIDKAVIYTWQEDPLNHPWMIWGYKGEGEYAHMGYIGKFNYYFILI